MGRQLQQMLEDETDEGFKHRLLTNRANRALARSFKYTGCLVTFMKTKVKLSKSLDRNATLAEIFKYTHTLKENIVRFADQRSMDHYMIVVLIIITCVTQESYTQRLEATTQQFQKSVEDAGCSAASVVDPDAVWHETNSAPYKNREYELGSLFASSLHTSMSASASSQAIDLEKGIDFRLRVQELT
ncbi:hypothetical protein Ahy_A02g008780 isoform A [Arachis hypogaea]|uniref:Uncharacterized protein n=1 Tax=Arachis hypogaea TaxID=3818 RepID=A0A445EF50_ARAHY|nr:hypothetical protein Ahy_A02g008780 isoform A [Arachis hypogaea]